MKACKTCGEPKPADAYRNNQATCNACYTERRRIARRAWRQRPGQSQRMADLSPDERVKYRARYTLNNALRDGKIHRKPCSCGSLKVQAHHHDHGKPLDVEWLCSRGHTDRHLGRSHT